jgi:hypothetical protein
MAAPVPAPSAPVLTARHPGVTPQPASASDTTANIANPARLDMHFLLGLHNYGVVNALPGQLFPQIDQKPERIAKRRGRGASAESSG